MNSHNPVRPTGRTVTAEGRTGADEQDRAERTITSESLFKGSREIAIEHNGALYRLRITRQGKLILNK